MKLLKCDFLDTNRVFTLIGGGRKSFGVNRVPGCTSVEIGLIFSIDHTILRSPGPSHGSKFNKNAIKTFLMYYKVIVGIYMLV